MTDRSVISVNNLRRGDNYLTASDTVGCFFVIDTNGNTIGTSIRQDTRLVFSKIFSDYVIFKILSGDYEGKELLMSKEFVNNTYLKFP